MVGFFLFPISIDQRGTCPAASHMVPPGPAPRYCAGMYCAYVSQPGDLVQELAARLGSSRSKGGTGVDVPSRQFGYLTCIGQTNQRYRIFCRARGRFRHVTWQPKSLVGGAQSRKKVGDENLY